MANYAANSLVVTGVPERVDAFRQSVDSSAADDEMGSVLDLRGWMDPDDEPGLPSPLGVDLVTTPIRLEYRFVSRNAPPLELLQRASADWPGLVFTVHYSEDGAEYAGVTKFRAGECLQDRILWGHEEIAAFLRFRGLGRMWHPPDVTRFVRVPAGADAADFAIALEIAAADADVPFDHFLISLASQPLRSEVGLIVEVWAEFHWDLGEARSQWMEVFAKHLDGVIAERGLVTVSKRPARARPA